MATFAYAPDIRVHINTTSNGLIDVSNDLANWEVIRRSNAVSTFNFTLQNPQRKYDGLFRPGDQISVELKRVVWCRVFTGTLNVTPIFSAWPRALPMSASCTMKKLQFWPWDPSTTAANALLGNWHAGDTEASILGDGGLSGLMRNALVKVTNWDSRAIHIGEVPTTWFRWAQDVEKRIDLVSNMAAVIGSFSTINGASSVGNITLSPGPWADQTFDAEQISNATQIFAAVLGYSGLSDSNDQDIAALYCLMTAMAESSLRNSSTAVDHTSVGLYQQQVNWGSVDNRTNIIYATKSFLGVNYPTTPPGLYQKVPNWRTFQPINDAIAIVQVPQLDYQNRYGHWQDAAQAIVTAARQQFDARTQPTNGPFNPTTGIPTGQGFTGIAAAFADQALQLATSHPEIPYNDSRDGAWFASVVMADVPVFIDCSGLVDWAYYHTAHAALGANNSGDQYALCKGAGLDIIPVSRAKFIQGALVFIDKGNQTAGQHVAISLGNGKVADAGGSGPNGAAMTIQDFDGQNWNEAGMLPTLDYSGSVTDPDTLSWLKSTFPTRPWTLSSFTLGGGTVPTGANSTVDPVRQLINALAVNPAVGGDIFGGSRQYIHTQPFLPWLKNLCNSSMRSFCSAPNGDFMAWFPDYFGVFGTAGIMNIEPIELMDFTVDWSDQQIVTHEFVTGTQVSLLDQGSGQVVDASTPDWANSLSLLATHGIATMDFPEIFKAIWGKEASSAFIQEYLARFGVRPNVEQMPNINTGPQEFFIALWNFMFYWAAQFNAVIPMTFMPELYPGMLIRIPKLNFQAYIVEVEHSGSYGDGGKFVTNAKVVAPARITNKTNNFGLIDFLPVAEQDQVK